MTETVSVLDVYFKSEVKEQELRKALLNLGIYPVEKRFNRGFYDKKEMDRAIEFVKQSKAKKERLKPKPKPAKKKPLEDSDFEDNYESRRELIDETDRLIFETEPTMAIKRWYDQRFNADLSYNAAYDLDKLMKKVVHGLETGSLKLEAVE